MFAAMAQLVEHILGKDEVPSSNLGSSSRQPRREIFGALAFYRGFEAFFKGVPFYFPGLSGVATHALNCVLLLRSRTSSHTPLGDRQACLPGGERGYLHL